MKIRKSLIVELGVNLLLPWLAYRLALPHWGPTGALYASAIPPIVWSLVEFARFRRVDALSALVLLGIAMSCIAMAMGGSPRLLLVRESLISGAIGVAFLASLVLPRPLTFYLARASTAREANGALERFEAAWRDQPRLRRSIWLMTLVWGTGLTLEALIRSWLAWHWTPERYLVVSPFIGYGIYGGLMLWTLWFRRRLRGRGRAATAQGGAGTVP
jgi:hypothetical protein